ncbi:MAG: DUF3866 family protein [Acidimicrobiales bacterium]
MSVVALLSERAGLQRVLLDSGRRAFVLTELIGTVAVGDEVVVNTTAVDLGLGTGGYDVVHWNLSRRAWSGGAGGHLMKLRYTSLQADTGVAEEHPGYRPPASLAGLPVVVCGLHSQVAPVAAAFKDARPDRRLVYVMTDQAALPLALSDLVADLRAAGLLDATVTAGQAFGGDHEAVNTVSALEVAVALAGAEAVVVAAGPGSAGTGTRHGFSALDVGAVIDAVGALGARPIVALRWSGADPRPRHWGLSQHSVEALALAHRPALLAVPRGQAGQPRLSMDGHTTQVFDVPDVAALLASRGIVVTTMGRGPTEDP